MTFKGKLILNCNEAIAWAALASDVNLVAHYPGSPVNQIETYIKKLNDRFKQQIKFNDSLNEHIAALAAAGASFAGARSMCIMKHVGMNIAADPFNYLGYTGVKGGMVIIAGTDPGANSSTGEEDIHWYIPQFNFPLFEPTSVQECYDYTKYAFELSEKYEIPVILFIPGRLAYNYSEISIEIQPANVKEFTFVKDRERYINVGARAVANHKKLIQKISAISRETSFTKQDFNPLAKTGILTRGLTYSITAELIQRYELGNYFHLMNLDLVYPIPEKVILEFVKSKNELIFIEDQDGFLENQIKMKLFNKLECIIEGKSIFPAYGEVSAEMIDGFFKSRFEISNPNSSDIEELKVPERIGTFCEGCPHTGTFFCIDSVMKSLNGVIGGDIGCSSLAPFRADWLLCMNAGIGISQGMAQVITNQPILSTGGDGSFFHAGALSLMNAVQNNINLVHLILDNSTVAMTGHQHSPTSGDFDLKNFVSALGVKSIYDVSPYEPKHFISTLKEVMQGEGVRVLIVKGECVIAGNPRIESRRNILYPEIDPSKCADCNLCYRELACPAIVNIAAVNEKEKYQIDLNRCVRCGVCHEICPNDAISINYVK
jgi:indolepyruvate ferredoxin oxidoreductase alpha subunit